MSNPHSNFVVVRLYLDRAIEDIDFFLSNLQEQENVDKEMAELYRRMEAGETPPEIKGQGQPVQLTEEQQEAFFHGTYCGKPLTDEEREAALAEWPSIPLSDAKHSAQKFAARGGWQESSRQAAAWLRHVGKCIPADGTEAELAKLSKFQYPINPSDLQDYFNAQLETAKQVRAIFAACLTEQAAETPPTDPTKAATNHADDAGAGGEKTVMPSASKETLALATLALHPDWPDTKIAETVGCNRTSLYRWDKYKQAREILEQEKRRLPSGSKDKDGKLEAWDR